jgi:hypothetical protein
VDRADIPGATLPLVQNARELGAKQGDQLRRDLELAGAAIGLGLFADDGATAGLDSDPFDFQRAGPSGPPMSPCRAMNSKDLFGVAH